MAQLRERNQEIGSLLREARRRKHLPVTQCANLISTSRRRYAAMESGSATIGAAELEVLMVFLEIPAHEVWTVAESRASPSQVFVQAQPGETVQIVVAVQK